jgi:hypothetical protein
VRGCGHAPHRSALFLVGADCAVHRADLEASTGDFALDGLHVLCADGQRVSLLRLPDLDVVRQRASDATWLRAIDPVLAISCGGRPAVLTIWHVPTLTPLARFDGGSYGSHCAAVDRHRRWLAVASFDRIHVFSIVR